MTVYKGRSDYTAENNRLLRDIQEEVRQLRAATKVFTELVERLSSSGEPGEREWIGGPKRGAG